MTPTAITLRLAPRSPTAHIINGEVALDLAVAQDEKIDKLRVKCRGEYKAVVQVRQSRTVHRNGQAVHESYLVSYPSEKALVRYDVDLWSTYDHPMGARTDVVTFPFQFVLPQPLPPTCPSLESDHASANIAYYIEAVAERTCMLSRNRRDRKYFLLLPSQPLLPEQLRSDLPNWQGPWREAVASKTVKKGLFLGSPCNVKVQLFTPDLQFVPMHLPIPIRIHVSTFSKLMDADDKVKEPLYPPPPDGPGELELAVNSDVRVRVDGHEGYMGQSSGNLPGFAGTPLQHNATQDMCAPTWQVLERVWFPEEGDKKGGKGRWKQEVVCTARVIFKSGPNFATENITQTHTLSLTVPATGSDLTLTCPINLITGMA